MCYQCIGTHQLQVNLELFDFNSSKSKQSRSLIYLSIEPEKQTPQDIALACSSEIKDFDSLYNQVTEKLISKVIEAEQ